MRWTSPYGVPRRWSASSPGGTILAELVEVRQRDLFGGSAFVTLQGKIEKYDFRGAVIAVEFLHGKSLPRLKSRCQLFEELNT